MAQKKYRIVDSWLRSKGVPERPTGKRLSGAAHWLLFEGSKKQVRDWIIEGLSGTEGAERDHYVDLLLQLESGITELDYRRT